MVMMKMPPSTGISFPKSVPGFNPGDLQPLPQPIDRHHSMGGIPVDHLHGMGGLTFGQLPTAMKREHIKDAFDRRDHAQSIINQRAMQNYFGWDPSKDVQYQAACRELKQANRDIKMYASYEPQMVADEAQRHTAMGKLWGAVEGIGRWLSRPANIVPEGAGPTYM